MTERTPIIYPSDAQCIEYNLARILLSEWYDLYRKDDSLLWLLPHHGTGWHEPAENEKPLHSFTVDQGFFSSIWDGTRIRVSYRCEELIYSDNFLRALAYIHIPGFTPAPCHAMGRGRRTRHNIAEYHTALKTAGVIASPKGPEPVPTIEEDHS